MHGQSTFYDVLDVSPDASRDEIQAAYREKVKQTHPDVSDDPDAETQFKRVTRAREVLTDPDERARYDRLGHSQYVDGSTWDAGDPDGTAHADSTDSPTAGPATDEDSAASGTAAGDRTAGTTDGTGGAATGSGRESRAESAGRSTANDGVGATGAGDASGAAGTGTSDWSQRGSKRGGANATAGGYATRTDYKEQSFDRVRVPLTPQSLIQVGTMFVCYPVFLFASLSTIFPPVVNVVVGLCTLFVIAYLLSIPEVGIVVFGGWGVLAPAALVALPGPGIVSLFGVVALTACWVPFGLAVLTRAALRT
jgi:curved DNA-binding protein CbpA